MDYDDEYDPYSADEQTYNTHFGSPFNSVQARDIHGDVVFHHNEPTYFTALPWGFSVAAYAALFILAGAYGDVFANIDLGFWDCVKVLLSTALVVPIFLATEYRLHGIEFVGVRLLAVILTATLGAHYGRDWELTADLSKLLSSWLIWRF